MKFRKAKIEDASSIVEIHNENARKNMDAGQQSFLLNETSVEKLTKRLNSSATQYFVATIEEKVVGFLQISIGIPDDELEEYEQLIFYNESDKELVDNKHVHLLTLAVYKDYQNKGIAKFIYESLFENFKGYSFSGFVVEYPLENRSSIRFHEYFGFEILGRFISDFHFSMKDYRSIFFFRRK